MEDNNNQQAGKQILCNPIEHVIVTPINCICKICFEAEDTKKHAIFTIAQKSLRTHFKHHHGGLFELKKFNNITTILRAQQLKAINGQWRNQQPPTPIHEKHTMCLGCGKTFGRKSKHFKRHTLNANPNCKESAKVKTDCAKLICGGWFPIPSATNEEQSLHHHLPSSLDKSARMPAAACITMHQYEVILQKYVDESSIVGNWPKVLSTFVAKHGENSMGEYVKTSLNDIISARRSPDPVLAQLIECSNMFADHFTSVHSVVPGNILSAVQNFNTTGMDDSQNYRSIFSVRKTYTSIKHYFHHLLAFLFINKCPLLDTFIYDINDATFSAEDAYQYAMIPSLIYDLARQHPPKFGELTWLLEHAQIYCFHLESGEAILDDPGWGASKLSTALHAIRAGICGKLLTMDFTSQMTLDKEESLAIEIQEGYFVNMISRWIRELREQYKKQLTKRSVHYDAMENIIIDGIVFKKSIYTQLVPTLYKLFREQFSQFFDGDEWEKVLDLSKGINVTNWFKLEFSLEGCNELMLEVLEKPPGDIPKLCAILEFCLFGFGLGACRLEEVTTLTTTQFYWSGGSVYYGVSSNKRGSSKANTGDLVRHRLPFIIGRCLLLSRFVFENTADVTVGYKKVFPTITSGPEYTMMDLSRLIFELKPNVGNTTQVRHLFHSMTNLFYPDGVENYGLIISMPGLSEASHHSDKTAAQHYSTRMESWKEMVTQDYHYKIGDTSTVSNSTVVPQAPRRSSDADEIVKLLFGPDASFRSPKQKEATLAVLNKINQHHAVLLPCGEGKTLLTLAPSIDSHCRGVEPTTTIIVAPHINLVAHQTGQIKSLLQCINLDENNPNKILCQDFNQIGTSLPASLSNDDSLPNIVVMSIMAFSSLLRYHHGKVLQWYESGRLGNVFLDEIQLITSETIRKEYHDLTSLASIGVPVTLLSGSLSEPVLHCIAKYLGLTNNAMPIDVILSTDLVGTHFNFQVIEKPRYSVEPVVQFTKQVMSQCHVHIICATTTAVANIYDKLKDNEKVRSIIGSDTSQRKKQTADDWRTGAVEVLISSTCALVGNENKKCRHIIIVDRIYDLSNLLQAIGRLRKEQGGKDSCITHFLSSEEVNDESGTNKATTAKMKELANIGLSVDEIKHEAEQQLTPCGYNSLFTKQGCLLKNLSLMFGGDRENDCRRCTNCDTIYNTTIATHGRAPSFLSPNSTEIQGQIYDDATKDKEEASSTTPDNYMGNAQMMSLLQALNQDSPKATKVNWGAVSKHPSKKRPLQRKDDRKRKNTKLHGQHQPAFKLG